MSAAGARSGESSAGPAGARISFDRVSVEFPVGAGTLRVVEDVSFEVADREFVSIIGPSGCGKTTMMNIVAGFVQPTRGSVLLDGRPIAGPGPERGVIFQEYGVFPWLTVEENIAFGLKLAANRAGAADRSEICRRYMRLMGLSEFGNAYPKTLSGGMRQRLAIARAYAVNPQFLLMDEPFGALDAQTRAAMQDEEAIYLSSRIIVVTARPSRIREVIEIPFGYPRHGALHEDPKFAELRAHVRDLVMQEYAAQARQSFAVMD